MIARLKNLLPDSLAGRIVLLLTIAILVANLIAMVVLSVERANSNRDASDRREIERVAALVPALEAVDHSLRGEIARDASTRFAQVRVEPAPRLRATAPDARSRRIAQELAETLERENIAVAIVNNNQIEGRRRDVQVLAISIALRDQNGPAAWLNVMTVAAPPRPSGIEEETFLTILALSLVSVLAVALLFARRLTRPLGQLAAAAQAAGRGDRSARVPEEGAREMRDAAHAFNAMQSEISQFDAERMRMVAALGHDLRTPMTSLRIRAEMIDDEDTRDAMVRTLDEMTVMADGLVSFVKDGQDAEDPAPVQLDTLLTTLCAERGAEFSASSPVEITARPVALGRAIGNLIDNALRYGGSAAVTLDQTRSAAMITVRDTGPGIPETMLDEMFQPFTRGDNSRSTETGGAGLGLSIARNVIIAHGGSIELANHAEGGLVATVTLPRTNAV